MNIVDNHYNFNTKGHYLKTNSVIHLITYSYLILLMFANGTIVFNVVSLIYLGVNIIYTIRLHSKVVNGYIISLIVFILFNLLLILLGNYQFIEATLNRLVILTINVTIAMFLIDYMKKNFVSLSKFFPMIVTFFLVYIYILSFDTILQSRLAFELYVPFSNRIFYNPNIIGYFITLAITMIIISRNLKIRSKNYWLIIIFYLITLALLGGRKTFIMNIIIITLGHYLFLSNRKNKLKHLVYGSLLTLLSILAIYSIPVFYETIGERLIQTIIEIINNSDITDSSAFHRSQMNQIAYELFRGEPFTGYGLDSFRYLSIYGTYTHNNFLEILVSSGIIGLLIYYSSYIVVLVKILKHKYKNLKNLLILVFLLMIIFDYGVVSYSSREILLIMYYIYSVPNIGKRISSIYEEKLY